MTDLPPYPGTPRWVKVSGIIGLVAVVLFGIVAIAGGGPGGGSHGPALHIPSSDNPPASVSEEATPPGDGRGSAPPEDHEMPQP